jgi:SAM-dependent methyltransferase
VPENHFDERVAAGYDASVADMFEAAALGPVVDFLVEAAAGGRALELGIGTGRLALPLRARGVDVCGIDLSPPMVAQLRAKPGGRDVDVAIGDFAATIVPGRFSLVYLVFNTIMNLTTQDAQVAVFENAAAHLEPGGAFVVEVVVPDLRRLPPGTTQIVLHAEPGYVGIDEYTDFTHAQLSCSHHYRVVDGDLDVVSVPFRYVWPAELDVMARVAGLRLRDRWADWARAPFTGDSRSHVSVWEKPPASDATDVSRSSR